MNKKKAIIGVLMAAMFVMMAFVPIVNTIQTHNDNKNIPQISNEIKFTGITNILNVMFKNDTLNKTIEYRNIMIHENSIKINQHTAKVNFHISAKNLNINTSGIIISDNNTYYISNGNTSKLSSYIQINQKNNQITFGPGGTYYYYITTSGKSSHTWHSSISTGTWNACSQAIVSTSTFFITWNGPSVVLLFGFIPALYLPSSTWHASNGNGWSLGCGAVPYEGNGKIMPVSGSKTVHNYHGSDTTMKIVACWNYGVAGE